MDFPWYKVKSSTEQLTQGDIILSLKVPNTRYNPLKAEDGYMDFGPVEHDVIILTQACDMQNNKVKNVVVCKIGSLHEHIHKYFHTLYMKPKIAKALKNGIKREDVVDDFDYSTIAQKTRMKLADQIRSGKFLDLYLLNEYRDEINGCDFRVVYLRESFKMPLESLEKAISNEQKQVLSLLPPYREHLSYSYSFNFSRIGLPVDIRFEESSF
ncbi:hypothetical protein [Bacillus pumilus]|uniref:hypothetical protein n=1 Tax=Bacillus pumilus TaxID=1408 RepID=UPI0011A5A4CF|nr:hypothetical protein [Bacillus pumilus]